MRDQDQVAATVHDQVAYDRQTAANGRPHRGDAVQRIELSQTIETLRQELMAATANRDGAEIAFPVEQIVLEFNVGVTTSASGDGRLKFWVLELGVDADITTECVQKVVITLGAPTDDHGRPVRVVREFDEKP